MKINELEEYLCALKTRPRVICINETFANENVSDAQLAIRGYEMVARRDGTDTGGGRCRGLVIYTEEGLGAVRTKHAGEDDIIEAATIEVRWGGERKITICQVYRKQNDVENTLKLLEYLAKLPDQTVTVGDYNFPTIRWEEGRGGSEEERRFLQLLQERGWEQRVRGVTRPLGGNTLDLATGPAGLLEEYELLAPLGASDHKAVQVWLGGWRSKAASSVELTPVWSKVNWVELILHAQSIDWKVEVAGPHLSRGDPLAAMEAIYKELRGLQGTFIPLRRRRSRTRPKWSTTATRQAIREKMQLWKILQNGREGDMSDRLQEASRKVYRANRKARRDFENHIADNDNKKLLYSYIKSKAHNRVSVGPLRNKEGKEVTECKEMADLLADHYSTVFKTEVLPMEEVRQLYQGDNPLLDTHFSEAFVRLQLSRLRETLATGPDGVYPRLLKRICIHISEALADVYNSLLEHSKVPGVWLDSHISPIYKPGKVKTAPSGYRPVGVTSTLCRVFERRLNISIDHHLESNNLIDDSQHGFRRGRSCETNLLLLMEYHAQRAEDNEDEDDCYFDLKAYFDGIPHQRCLASLHAHGVLQSGKIHKWITAWLGAGGETGDDNQVETGAERQVETGDESQVETGAESQMEIGAESQVETGAENRGPLGLEKEPGIRCQDKEQKGSGGQNQEKEAPPKARRRRQRVILNGKASDWHEVTASVIQGSCLGPTLAKCFSNTSHFGRILLSEDKPLVSKFADDEKRCRVVMSKEQGDRMQDDINNMVSWAERMNVELNHEKVHLLHIGKANPKRKYTLGEGGPEIRAVDQEKDLGVIISNDLKPDKMVNKQAQKAHVKLSQFNSTFTYRGKTWMKLYNTYVKPSMMYSSEAWKPCTREGVDKLEAVQRRAVRMAGGQGNKSYREVCREAGLNTVKEQLDEADMVRVFRIMNGQDKIEKANFWTIEEATEGAGRRRFKTKEIRRTVANQRKDARKNSFASRVQDPWNSLSESVKSTKNPKQFRKAYRREMKLV